MHFGSLSHQHIIFLTIRECNAISTSGLKGVCMTATECNDMSGGTKDGNCAASFGVCCVVTYVLNLCVF